MERHIERQRGGRRNNDMGFSRGARFHYAIFVVGEGATDFYDHILSARAAAQRKAIRLTNQDRRLRHVTNIGEWESYIAFDPNTNQRIPKFHGVDDGFGHT